MDENIPGSAEEQHAQESLVFRMRAQYPRDFDYLLYFYEGRLQVRDNVIEVPADKRHWAQRAYTLGFRLDMAGERINYAEMLAWFDNPYERTTDEGVTFDTRDNPVAADDESGETAEETADESTDAGRQPLPDDGLRPSPEERDGSVSDEGLGSGDGDGAADDGAGDDAAGEAVRADDGGQPRTPSRRRRSN